MQNNTIVTMKHVDEDGKANYFSEGDKVICYTVDKQKYKGRILQIGRYRRSETSEPELAIHIDTSQSYTSFSSQIVFTKDITYMGWDAEEELAQERGSLVEFLCKKGYKKEKAENIFDKTWDLMNLFNETLIDVKKYMDYAVENHCPIRQAVIKVCAGNGERVGQREAEEKLTEIEQKYSDMAAQIFRDMMAVCEDLDENGREIPRAIKLSL